MQLDPELATVGAADDVRLEDDPLELGELAVELERDPFASTVTPLGTGAEGFHLLNLTDGGRHC